MREIIAGGFQWCADKLRRGMTRQQLLDDVRYWSKMARR